MARSVLDAVCDPGIGVSVFKDGSLTGVLAETAEGLGSDSRYATPGVELEEPPDEVEVFVVPLAGGVDLASPLYIS